MKQLTSFCLDWHVTNSDAFKDMLVEPLAPYADIKLRAWDGEKLPPLTSIPDPLIFSMLPPPEELLKQKNRDVVWLPMWDQARGYDQNWWNNLPKNLRVVAFSEEVYKKANAANLPCLRITYYKNPTDFQPVSWNNGNILFYWNRTGMIGPEFIEKLCAATQAKKLVFLGTIDPRIDEAMSYELPSKIGNTAVTKIDASDRTSFLRNISEANLFVAPRISEGVGMTFLEAMARGCAVFAYDGPTMSEYIINGKNGVLFQTEYKSLKQKTYSKFGREVSLPTELYQLSSHQPWKRITKMNFQKIGQKAREDHIAGYKEWQRDIPNYAKFVLGG